LEFQARQIAQIGEMVLALARKNAERMEPKILLAMGTGSGVWVLQIFEVSSILFHHAFCLFADLAFDLIYVFSLFDSSQAEVAGVAADRARALVLGRIFHLRLWRNAIALLVESRIAGVTVQNRIQVVEIGQVATRASVVKLRRASGHAFLQICRRLE
jgi:hypothetical protein